MKFKEGQRVQYSAARKENLRKRNFPASSIDKTFVVVGEDRCPFTDELMVIIRSEETNIKYKIDEEDLEKITKGENHE